MTKHWLKLWAGLFLFPFATWGFLVVAGWLLESLRVVEDWLPGVVLWVVISAFIAAFVIGLLAKADTEAM